MKRVGGILDRQLCIEMAKQLKYVNGQVPDFILKGSNRGGEMVPLLLSVGAIRQIGLLVREVERIERDSITLTARKERKTDHGQEGSQSGK